MVHPMVTLAGIESMDRENSHKSLLVLCFIFFFIFILCKNEKVTCVLKNHPLHMYTGQHVVALKLVSNRASEIEWPSSV